MAQVTNDDPWNWDTERVIAELCSVNRSWEPPSGRVKFPPLNELEDRLRQEDVDGLTILTTDHSELCRELNFTTLKQKATLRYAIETFRSRSHGFRHHQKRLNADFESQPRNGDDLTPSTSNGDSNPFVKQSQPTPTPSLDQVPNSPQPSAVVDDYALEAVEEPVSKRRRIVPMLISTDINGTLSRNIPTEADMISTNRALNTGDINSQADSGLMSSRTYLGKDALTRLDVLGEYGSIEKDEQSVEDQGEFSYRRELPHGRRIQVHRVMKRHSQRSQVSFKFRGTRVDLVPGANDPDHDELLPLYGDSDEEYDSETWDEIEAERAEQADMDNESGLGCDEVKAILDDCIEQFISDWKERKLSKLPIKANKIWLSARKAGLRRSILNVRTDHDACQARIIRFCNEITLQQYRDASEVKEQALILQQSVEDREHHSWVLGVLNASVEPEKLQSSRNLPKKSRVVKPTAPDEEILTSESEEDVDDFIVNDDPIHPGSDRDPSPMDVDRDNDISHAQQEDAEDYHQNADSTCPDQTDTIDLTQLEDTGMSQKNSPVKSRGRQVVDLTSPVKLSKKKRGNSSTGSRPKPVTQEAEPSTLMMKIDDLEPAEQMVAKELTRLDQSYLNVVFTLAHDTRSESDWLYVMNDELKHQDFPKPPHDAQKRKTVAIYTLLRLFEIYRDGVHLSMSRYKKLTYDDIIKKMNVWSDGGKVPEKVNSYVDFLCRLSDRFDWKRCSEASPPVKRRRHRKLPRNVDAENLREADKERTAEQYYRRQILREKLKLQEYSGIGDLDTQKIIINESKSDNDGFIYVHPEIAQRIKEHQVAGVRFMWNQIVDSASKQGCLLAHTMGLGKTMQIITFLVALAEAAHSDDPTISSQIPESLRKSKTLIICPPSLLDNWMDELLLWAPEGHKMGDFFKVDQPLTGKQRLASIAAWDDRGGILLIGYSLFKNIGFDNEDVLEVLHNSPNLVVADEAHEIKNPDSQVHAATSNFRTHSRIALTGSPLANCVDEYHSMINWVAPNYLSDIREFRSEYSHPIKLGLKYDATAYERRHAVKMLNALKQEVGPKVQRITTAVLKHDIPLKQEYIVVVPLTPLQREAYETYVRYHNQNYAKVAGMGGMAAGETLGILCAHPLIMLKKLQKEKADNNTTKANLPRELVGTEIALINKTPDVNDYSLSWKIVILLTILEECKRVGDAVLIFSQSLSTLDYLERIIVSKKFSSVRLDGRVSTDRRQNMVKDFNKGNVDIFLISTQAGGVGLNMTTANRIILFDTKFNPQNELQAIGRAYRIGQKKPVYVYRLVCGGTLEDNLFNMAVRKLQLTSRVVDEKKPIPKAGASDNRLKMPEEPVQKDISKHIGKDAILDKVIEQHQSGIRALDMMDTFEEEEHEEAALTVEECAEVNQLIKRNERRRSEQKTTIQAHSAAPARHQDLPALSPIHEHGIDQVHYEPITYGNNGDTSPEFFTRCITSHLVPIQGQGDIEAKIRKNQHIAQSITETIVSRKLPDGEQEQIFLEIQQAVRIFQFRFALCSGCISPTQLGNMNATQIVQALDEWKFLSWEECFQKVNKFRMEDGKPAASQQSTADPEVGTPHRQS